MLIVAILGGLAAGALIAWLALRGNADAQSARVGTLENDCAELKTQLTALQSSSSQLAIENAQLKDSCKGLESVEAEFSELQNAKAVLDSEHFTLAREFENLSGRVSAQEEGYKGQLRQLQNSFDSTERELTSVRKLHNSAEGQLQQSREQLAELRANLKAAELQRDEAQRSVTQFEAAQARQDAEHVLRLAQAEKQRESWEKQEKRVLSEEKDAQDRREAYRDRIWSEHQGTVVARFVELCKLPDYQLPMYTSELLPPEWIERFGTRFKPDILIQLENQFVVFDAKYSKAGSLSTYISTQVKSFATKAEGNQLIYPAVFFVVPTFALSELKEVAFRESGYRIYVVAAEAVPTLLAMFKRLEGYALADKLDPVERENIVNALAHLHHHIRYRNAASLIMAEQGIELLNRADEWLPDSVLTEVRHAIERIRMPSIPQPQAKKLVANLDNQQALILDMSSPKAMVSSEDLDSARLLTENEASA